MRRCHAYSHKPILVSLLNFYIVAKTGICNFVNGNLRLNLIPPSPEDLARKSSGVLYDVSLGFLISKPGLRHELFLGQIWHFFHLLKVQFILYGIQVL